MDYYLFFTKIGDYLLKLSKAFDLLEKKKKERLECIYDLCSELFDDLIVVHSDYIQMFNDFDKQLCKGINPALSHIKSRRLEFEPLRDKVQTLIKAWADPTGLLGTKLSSVPPSVDLFFYRVLLYFPYHGLLHRNTFSSEIIDCIESGRLPHELAEDPNIAGATIEEKASKIVDWAMTATQEKWSLVTVAYAEVRYAKAGLVK